MVRASVKTVFKAQTNRSVFHRVELAIYQALGEAVERTIAYGERVAKKHAPVRKVTRRGGRPQTRELDDVEIADLPEEARKGLNPITNRYIQTGERPRVVTKRSLAGYQKPGTVIAGRTRKGGHGGRAREVLIDRNTGERTMRNPAMADLLSSRGRRELEGGRNESGTNLDGVYIKRFTYDERTKRRDPRTGKTTEHSRIRHGYRATLGGRLRDQITSRLMKVGPITEGLVESPTEYARYVEFPTSRTAAQPYMRPARTAMQERLPKEIERSLVRASRTGGG